MNREFQAIGALAISLAFVVCGCSTSYELSVLNGTDRDLGLDIQTPEGRQHTGTIAPGAEQAYEVEISDSSLPAECSMQAGERALDFQLQEYQGDPPLVYFLITRKGIEGPSRIRLVPKTAVVLNVLNGTERELGLDIQTPEGRTYVGTMARDGEVSHTVTLPNSSLPAGCSIHAGGLSQEFELEEYHDDAPPLHFLVGQDGIKGPSRTPILPTTSVVLTVQNQTERQMGLDVQLPTGREHAGIIAPEKDLAYEAEVLTSSLPAMCSFHAGDRSYEFQLDKYRGHHPPLYFRISEDGFQGPQPTPFPPVVPRVVATRPVGPPDKLEINVPSVKLSPEEKKRVVDQAKLNLLRVAICTEERAELSKGMQPVDAAERVLSEHLSELGFKVIETSQTLPFSADEKQQEEFRQRSDCNLAFLVKGTAKRLDTFGNFHLFAGQLSMKVVNLSTRRILASRTSEARGERLLDEGDAARSALTKTAKDLAEYLTDEIVRKWEATSLVRTQVSVQNLTSLELANDLRWGLSARPGVYYVSFDAWDAEAGTADYDVLIRADALPFIGQYVDDLRLGKLEVKSYTGRGGKIEALRKAGE
jgi:hypothetical protein